LASSAIAGSGDRPDAILSDLEAPRDNPQLKPGSPPPPGIGLSPSTPLEKLQAAATLTDAESVSLMKSHVAYTGKYDVDLAQTPDGIKITIHVDAASNQALTGTNRVLYARVDGNKMTAKSPTLVVGTSGVTSVVELEYVKAE
jgi:lipocalin-like protein